MKRTFLAPLAAAALSIAMLPVHAQSTAKPAAKVEPKSEKAAAKPAAEKPKGKLLTRDELRSCMANQRDNDAEAKSIKAEEAEYKAAHKALLDEKAALDKRETELTENFAGMKAERDSILKLGESISKPDPKTEKEEIMKLRDEYTKRAAAFDTRIADHDKNREAHAANRKSFDGKIDGHNKRREVLQERIEKHLDVNDEWKEKCANKPYDERDEIALKKELAAQGK